MKRILSFVVIMGMVLSLIPFGYNTAKAEGIEDIQVIWVDYNDVGDFCNGIAVVETENEQGSRKYGAIDKTGKFVKQYKYTYVGDFIDGVAVVNGGYGDFGTYSVIDETGYLKQYHRKVE